ASKRNVHGEVYGFVKFANVKNVNKLTKALNAVCFGNYRIHARVAKFDRNDKADGERLRTEKVETKAAEVEVTPSVQVKEGDVEAEGVKVGEVLVRMGAQKAKVGNAG
ncbi:RNA recognition motif, partial [Trifolium medium]|nr:RNA recognition motif [Trifolium medium]